MRAFPYCNESSDVHAYLLFVSASFRWSQVRQNAEATVCDNNDCSGDMSGSTYEGSILGPQGKGFDDCFR